MHPRCRQVPPSRSCSTRATDCPSSAARNAAAYPPDPPPRMTRSNSSWLLVKGFSSKGPRVGGVWVLGLGVDGRAAGLQPRDGHTERRAGHIIQAHLVEEMD